MLRRRQVLLVLSALGPASLAAAGCGGASGARDWAGVRLGMSANDVRERFRPGGEGTWTHALEPEPVLRWVASAPSASIRRASFELHLGMLVAFTLVGGELTRGKPLETTRGSIAARRAGSDGPEVRVLSRDCETHRAEVQKLLSGSS